MQKTNNKETVLLYNVKGKPYAPQLQKVMLKLGIRIKVIAPDEYTQKIGEFVGITPNPSAEAPAVAPSTAIEDEMMIMHNFSQERLNLLLAELRKEGISIPLKAVVTPHNSNWSSYELHAELSEERKMIENMQKNKKVEATQNNA